MRFYIKYFPTYWLKVVKVASKLAFGRNWIRGLLMWTAVFCITLLVKTVMAGLDESLNSAIESAFVAVLFVVFIWCICFLIAPVKMHGPVNTRRHFSRHYENLSMFTREFQKIKPVIESGELERAETLYSNGVCAVTRYFETSALDQSWVDTFLDEGLLSTLGAIEMAKNMNFRPHTNEERAASAMSVKLNNKIGNLRKIRQNIHDIILKSYAES